MYHLFCRKFTGDRETMVKECETKGEVFSFMFNNIKKYGIVRIVKGTHQVIDLVDKEEGDDTVDIPIEVPEEVEEEEEEEEEKPEPEKKRGRGRPPGSGKKKPKDEKPMSQGQKIAMYGKHKECEDCPIYLIECNEPHANDPDSKDFKCSKKQAYEVKQEAD